MIAALALLAALQAAPVEAASPPKQYVTRFCTPIAMSDAGAGALRQHYVDWGAKLSTDAESAAYRPADVDAPGQMVSFTEDKDAPHAFVDRRRGACSLVYAGAHASPDLTSDLQTGGIILGKQGDKPTFWKRINTKRVGPPGPIRYFLPANDEGRFGLCATLFEDLRLHDETPATLVRVETCRIASDETFD